MFPRLWLIAAFGILLALIHVERLGPRRLRTKLYPDLVHVNAGVPSIMEEQFCPL